MAKTFFMFAGQGSQKPGMASHLLADPAALEVFAAASDVLGADVLALVQDSAPEELNRTANAQPALVAVELAEAHALAARGVEPDAVLGFSLGQVAALECAGMLSLEDVFRLTLRRAELMDEAAEARPGAMAAVLKLAPAEVESLCEKLAAGGVLVAANYNSPQQTVVSGDAAAVERLEAYAADHRIRTARLATSGGFHSPLMADAAEKLRAFLETLDFAEPRVPLVANDTALPLSAADAADAMARHLTRPVRFCQSVEALAAEGMGRAVEVGPGGVLSGLVRRIDPSLERVGAAELLG